MGAKIAQLRDRIKFQSLTRTTDGQGGWTESWTDLMEVWAQIRPISQKERFFSQQIQPTTTHKITIRWTTGLTPEMRILFDGRIFQIKGIIREDEQRWFMFIDAEEGVGS